MVLSEKVRTSSEKRKFFATERETLNKNPGMCEGWIRDCLQSARDQASQAKSLNDLN